MRWCNYSGKTTAICTSWLNGMRQPGEPGLKEEEGFPGGTWLRTSTMTHISYHTYAVVVNTASPAPAVTVNTIIHSTGFNAPVPPTYTNGIATPTISSKSTAALFPIQIRTMLAALAVGIMVVR